MTSLHDDILMFTQTAGDIGKWRQPNVTDALGFLAEEVGEAWAAYHRLPIPENAGWTRAHPGKVDVEDLLDELADVVFMAYVTAISVDECVDLATLVRHKCARRMGY
jgi:NTP pyrophosphatase (non-canonical NTP hydrolase)